MEPMTQAAVVSTTNLAITVSDLEVRDGAARVEDLRLAVALGFSSPHNIRALIRRYRDDLAVFGEVFCERKKPTAAGGRPGETFYLNEEQAIYITAKSDTPRAAEITVQMVRVFRDHLAGKAPVPAKPEHSLAFLFSEACHMVVHMANSGLLAPHSPEYEAALRLCFSTVLEATGTTLPKPRPIGRLIAN